MSTAGRGPMMAQPLKPPSAGRAAAYTGLFLLGAVVALAGALVQAAWLPGGLLLALAGATGLFLGGAYATGRRAGAVAPVAGWIIAALLLVASRPEGDFLYGAGISSYLFLLGGMTSAVICATLAPVGRPAAGPARLGK